MAVVSSRRHYFFKNSQTIGMLYHGNLSQRAPHPKFMGEATKI